MLIVNIWFSLFSGKYEEIITQFKEVRQEPVGSENFLRIPEAGFQPAPVSASMFGYGCRIRDGSR